MKAARKMSGDELKLRTDAWNAGVKLAEDFLDEWDSFLQKYFPSRPPLQSLDGLNGLYARMAARRIRRYPMHLRTIVMMEFVTGLLGTVMNYECDDYPRGWRKKRMD